MSYRGFGRGRGYGPRGTRAKGPFRLYFPPFRHVAPPRPRHPPFVSWQPNNGFYQAQLPQANQQFRLRGRGRRICNYDERYTGVNNLSTLPDCEEIMQPPPPPPLLPPDSPQAENNQINNVPQVPLPGSEEERQRKITETADRLKQKLSSFNSDKITDIWNDDVPLPSDAMTDGCIENRGIPELRYEPPELNLTYNDLKDIGRINPNHSKSDTSQHTTDTFSVNLSNINNEIILDESADGCEVEIIASHKIQDSEILPDNNECIAKEKRKHHKPNDNSNNFKRSDLNEDNIEMELLESNIRSQCDTLEDNVSQKHCDPQQGIVQKIEIRPIDVTQGQNTSVTRNLQNISLPTDLTDQNISREDMSQGEKKFVTNLEIQKAVLSSHVRTTSSNSNNCTILQSPLTDVLISNNIMLDNHQLLKIKEISSHSTPPKLSPHTERELPIDFDPSTPPPILLKQDQPCTLPSIPVYDLPLFNPTEPPPNMRHMVESKMSHENARPAWNINTGNQVAFKSRDVHTELNKQGGFQQLSLEISSQTNAFLPSHIDTINFPSLFSISSSDHPRIETNVPLALPCTQQVSHNTYAASSSVQEPLPFSDLHCNMNKDDGLNDMQEAMKFAKQMASITEKRNKESNCTAPSESRIQSVRDIESISLPPGKPTTRAKLKRKQDKCSKKLAPEEHGIMDYKSSSEEAVVQDVHSKPTDTSLMDEQDRPKVVFNLSNKTRKVNSVWQQDASMKKCHKRNDITQPIASDETHAASPVVRQNVENTIRRDETEENISKSGNSHSENTVSSNFTNQNTTSPYKRIQRDVCVESSQHSDLCYRKSGMLRSSKNHVEKDENSNSETSWKNQIIGRFLKMTKNEIYNMVNNTSRRKFDVIMKRLVKEKRSTLSLEMRHAQDEKMKQYDQQEFMKQLNAMLEPDATVAITDLPNEFIHHLNEVLQLDVLPSNITQSESSSTSLLDDTNDMFNPVTCTVAECTAKTATLSEINQECIRNKHHTARTAFDKDVQAHYIKNNNFNTKDDACSTKSNRSSTSSKLSILQHDLDDIFSEVTRKNQTPASMRKDCIAGLRNTNKSDDNAVSKNAQKETYLEDDRSSRSENCARWIEKCDRWKRNREDPCAYRNLTKEEWEAMYGIQVNPTTSFSVMKKTGDDKNLSNKIHTTNPYKRRRHSSESSKFSNKKHKTVENDKHKRSRRHSDERKQTANYSNDSSSSNCSTSSSSSSSSNSSSSDSSDRREPNVTKLLRVIKEKEKVAKNMSLNETIRDEVNAEIERERKQKGKKSHKSRKSTKRRKEKREHHKRDEKPKKKTASPSDCSLQGNETEASRLLMENEIKREKIEDQVTQKVVIKEELDISQDENIVDAAFTSALSHCANVETKIASLHPEFPNKPESPLVREISTMTVDSIESHFEDKPPASSPTQPKTKAQLKQMPEVTDTDDNKVSLPSGVAEDRDSMISSTDISKCLENSNKNYQAIEISYDDDKAEVRSAINNLINQDDNVDNNARTSHDRSDKNPVHQSNAIVHISVESSANPINIPKHDEIAVNTSNVTSTVASSSSVSSIPITSIATQKQGTNRKIDIKTYYERAIQRRMNEQGESKKFIEEPVVMTQNLSSIPKAVDAEVAMNNSISVSTHNGSINDPQLAKSVPHYTSNKNDIAQVKSEKYSQEDSNREPEVAELALKHSEKCSVVNTESAIKRIDKCKSEDRILHTADTNINTLPNTATIPKVITRKSKKFSKAEANVTSKKLQNKVSSDPRKFKNIRSEGGKELKLKKEMVKTQKTKRKSIVASKSADLTSRKIYCPRRIAAEKTKKVIQEKEMDNISDASKMNIKCTQAIDPYLNKINNNNTKMELATISFENTDNHNSESSYDTEKTKDCLSEPKLESRNIEEDIRNTNAHDQLSITTMQNEEACNIEHRNDTPSVEIANEKSLNAREISNIVPESDMSIDPIISNSEIKISSNTEEIYKEKLSLINENQQTNTKDTELSSNQNKTNEIEAEKLKKEDLLGSTNILVPIEKRDAVMIPEMDVISRLNVIDTQGELHDTYGPGSKNESEKIAELPVLNKHFQGEQDTENGIISPDSVGSPFKGFLEESIITFEQPNLLNIELDGIGADKEDKLLLDKHSVSCIIDPENYKEMEIERQRDYEMLDSVSDYTNDISISANEICSVTFCDTLLSSNKNANKKTDKSDLTTNEDRERSTEKSSSGVVTTILHQNKNINTDEDIETEKQLVMEEKYTSDTELEVKRAVFINEEETMQDENRSKDFIDKLTTTTDPSLSDALDTAASDETLRLSEIPTIEQLDNNIYLETNTSLEKMCDKSPGFDTDEHLDNMFYLDVRLQSTTFDSKDDVSAPFSDHRPSPQCEITPTITPESTMVVPCSDSSHDEIQKPEQCEFNFEHISPTDSDCNLLAKTSIQHSPIDTPRTLNIPTKAALKETARDLFLKSPNNISMLTKRDGISEETQQDETVDSYQTSAWQLDIYKNAKAHPQEAQNNTMTHDITNVNTTSLTQCSANDVSINTNANTNRSISLAPSDVHHSTTHHSPVIELEKIRESDNGREKETEKVSEKIESAINRDRKRLKSSILHKLKDNQRMKHRSQTDPLSIKTLSKKLRNMKQSGKLSDNTREAILARMLEIDIEMHKLTVEKLKLHEMLQNNVSVESSASNSTISTQETQENENAISVQPEVSLTLTTQSVQNSTETSNAELSKHLSPAKQSSNKQRNRTISHSSEDEEIIHYTQKMKTPVIRWKKIPRLDQTIKQRDQAEEEEENQGERRVRLTLSPTITKTTDSSIDVSRNTLQEADNNTINTVTVHDVQVQQTSTKNDEKSDCDIDTSARSTIYLSKNTISQQSEPQNSTERESNNTEHLLIQKNNEVDKKNENLAANETARINSQSNTHSTPEPLSIYSDDSTWDSLVNIASELHEKRKSTGLALLEETFKKELAISRRVKAVARKQKKKQLNNFLKSVNNLTVEEEDLPLSKLYIRKLQQKRDLLDTLSQRKVDVIVDPKILDNMEEVINAVAEDRVEDLYGSQSEARVPLDIPSTSNASSVSQAERHQFYVDVETNANPDWPSQEKENVEEIALQWQNDDNVSDKSSRAFTVVNQNKVPICDERNVEPDSSLTPEETLESHSSDYEHVRSKELSNTALRSFDIRVSVPKILIQNNFSLGLLRKFENTTDNSNADARLVDSTTNAFNATSVEKLEENREGDEIRRDTLSTIKPTVEKDKKREDSEMNLYEKDMCAIDANSNKQNIASRELQKQETTDTVRDTQSDVQSDTARIKYSNIIENENSNSVVSNGCDKITAIDLMRDVISSDSISKNIGVERIQNSSGNVENKIAAKEEKSYLENKSYAFKTIINSNQRMSSLLPTDSIEPVSENSEESNEMSIEKRHSPEPTTTSALSFSKVIKNIETNRKLVHRKKYSKSATVRRSIRYINENVKPSKINEVNANSNSSEQEQNVHEKDLTTHRISKSPVRDERIINAPLNVKKNRGSQKVQDTNVQNVIGAESEKNVVDPVKSHPTVLTEYAASKNKNAIVEKKRKHTKWQMMNCKVRLIDCKHTLLKPNVSSEILREFGIIIVNPYVPTEILCDRHNLVIPAAISEKSSLPVDNLGGKNKFKIEMLEDIPIKKDNEDDLVQESTSHIVEDNQEPVRMQYTVHKGPILDIKVFENSFLAASEDGKIYRYSRTSNGILNIYKGHKSAVTCLYIYKSDVANINKELMYSGSLDGTLRCYNITTGALIKNHVQINSPIQCMDQAWGVIFIGTKSGHVSRFHIKTGVIKGSNIQFSDKSVLALKATNEGPRKILIVASRNQPITIRDALTGLFLRTISSQKNHTVYSLMRHRNFIYCGTSSTSINVFNFTTGEQAIQYEAGVGIVCMRLYEELLFAGCYDGNIYVFDINNHKLICSIPGPGNMLLSIEVVHDKIIAGSKDKRLHSWQMPSQVRALLHKIT